MKKYLSNFLQIKMIITLLSLPFAATALLQAQTSNYIIGHSPSLNTQLLSEITDQKFSLLGFKYNNVTYHQGNIKLFNPAINKYTSTPAELYAQLQPLLVRALKPGEAIDENGDSGFLLSGTNFDIQIQDANNTNISQKTQSFCDLASQYPGPYHIAVSAELLLQTEYGVPRLQYYTNLEGLMQQPKSNLLLDIGSDVCYAQPELAAGNPGAANLWTPGKGFLVQSTTDYTQNFPSVGFDGAEFTLKVYGIDATTQNWQVLTDTPNSNISALATAIDPGTVQITLKGPISDNNASRVRFSGPSQFRIQNATTNTIFYGFKINRWFIASPKQDIWRVNKAYCEAGSNYSHPNLQDITNAAVLNTEPTTRKLGALIAEWGDVTQYTQSQFYNWPTITPFWTKNVANVGNPYYIMVLSQSGIWGYNDTSTATRRYGNLCINN